MVDDRGWWAKRLVDDKKIKRGLTFGDWSLDKKLSEQGGQADVWRGRSDKSDHSPPVAIKIAKKTDAQSQERFKKEAILLESVEPHQHIIKIYRQGEEHGYQYIVLELATFSLDILFGEAPKAGTKILGRSPSVLLTFFRQTCSAIAHLHKQDILHRDIKPSNILIIDEPRELLRTVIADLGIATEADQQGEITKTTEVVGSPLYRAPEVSLGHPSTIASDVYGLGRTLEALITLRHPQTIEPSPCPRGQLFSDEVCDALDSVVRKACSHRPEERFSSAHELASAIPDLHFSFSAGPPPNPKAVPEFDRRIAQVVTEIISEETDWEPTSLFRITQALDGVLSSYDITLALRYLKAAGFVDIVDDHDDHGNKFKACSITDAGIRLAREWEPQLREIVDVREERLRTTPSRYGRGGYGAGSKEDVPF